MSLRYRLKRGAYLWVKRLIRSIPLLDSLNKKRKEKRYAAVKSAMESHGMATAVNVCQLLNKHGITTYAMFGTLLGIVRNGGIIPHDYDMDFGLYTTSEFSWDIVDELMTKEGYSLRHQYKLGDAITERAYEASGFSFDLFAQIPVNGSTLRRSYFYIAPDNVVFDNPGDRQVSFIDLPIDGKIITVDTEEGAVAIPHNSEDILKVIYGDGWRFPDPDWVSGTGWTLLTDVIGKREVF